MSKKIVFVLLCFMCINTIVLAEVPQSINYQGYLTDGGGATVTDGAYLVKFTIYDSDIGGTDLWNSGFQNISVTNGLFTYALGSNVALPNSIFTDTATFLGITIGVDPEMTPRTKLITTPYAYHALRADTAKFTEATAGITQSFDAGDIILTGFLNLLLGDSINCPTDGYVMVNVSSVMNCNHTNGDDDVVFVLIVDSSYSILQDQDNRAWAVPASNSSDLYSTFIHVHKVFPVSAGWNEFNVIASQNAFGGTDNFGSSDVTLSLLFIPNSFGTVSVGTPAPPNEDFNKPLK